MRADAALHIGSRSASHLVRLGFAGRHLECAASLLSCCLSSKFKICAARLWDGTTAAGGPKPDVSCASMMVMGALSSVGHGHTLQAGTAKRCP